MSENKKEPSRYSIGNRVGAGAAALLMVGATTSCSESTPAYSEGHFSAVCLSGESPAIVDVAHSGPLPTDPSSKRPAWGVVRLSCLPSETEVPILVQDTERGGVCLGYTEGDNHLVVRAKQPEAQGPEFFTTGRGEVGVMGSSDLGITKAQMHHHDLGNTLDQAEYQRNCAPR